jgi:hypothetical protein
MFPHEIQILCPDLHESHESRVRWTHVRLMQLRLMAIPCGKFEIQSRLQSTKVDYMIGRAVNAANSFQGNYSRAESVLVHRRETTETLLPIQRPAERSFH